MNKRFYLVMLLLVFGLTTQGAGSLIEVRGLWAIDGDTILVEFGGRREEVRYVSMNAPRSDACLGEEARLANDQLIKGEALWLDLDLQDGEYRRDRNRRLLAHVFLEPVQTPSASVSVLLVAQGLARLDVWDPHDGGILAGQDFDVRYANWIIAVQTEAAMAWRGWWGACDPYRDSDLVIAAIKQWTDETVYIVNRGAEEIDLAAGWTLTSDPQQTQTLDFSCFATTLILPPGWVLRIHSGPIATGRGGEYHTQEDERTIDCYWIGRKIWRNDGDEAWLILSHPEEEPRKLYYYSYQLRDWD